MHNGFASQFGGAREDPVSAIDLWRFFEEENPA